MRYRRLFLPLVLLLCPMAVALRGDAPTLRDDAYHFGMYQGGPHQGSYAEWWYFNVSDPAQGLDVAVTYTVIDPSNTSGFGLASMTAIAFTPGSQFTETNVFETSGFLASSDAANVLIASASPPALNFVHVLSDDVYHIVGSVAGQHRMSWNLAYVRNVSAWLGLDRMPVGVLPWEQMSWIQYMPGASVTGTIAIDGREYRVNGVRGYHDHNWGTWIPFTVAWNWAEYFEPGLSFSIGDFEGSSTGVVSIEADGQRVEFLKGQYALLHSDWSYDASNQLWFPKQTWLIAQNETHGLVARLRARRTVPVRPPPQLPLPLVPVIYEQTAEYLGWLLEKQSAGGWNVVRSFAGSGWKEYTGISAVRQ